MRVQRTRVGGDSLIRSISPTRLGLALLAFLLGSIPALAQVSAKQGERDPNEFHDSMILELPFLPADPNLRTQKDWYNTPDYASLRKYQCDRIRIANLLLRSQGPAKDGKLKIEVRFYLQSPDQNHDKTVDLLLEVHNDDAVIATAKRSIKVEEGDNLTRDIELVVPESNLKSDPKTQLRITVHTKDV
jgi:hypothetical protein